METTLLPVFRFYSDRIFSACGFVMLLPVIYVVCFAVSLLRRNKKKMNAQMRIRVRRRTSPTTHAHSLCVQLIWYAVYSVFEHKVSQRIRVVF